MRLIIVTLSFLSFEYCFADTTAKATNLLKTISEQTQVQNFNPNQIPQIFGGSGVKLSQDNLSAKAIEISLSDEAVFQQTVKAIFEPLEEGILKRNIGHLSIFENNDAGFSFIQKPSPDVKDLDGVKLQKWTGLQSKQNYSEFVKSFNKYLKNFKSIEYTDISPYSASTPISRRSPINFQPNFFSATVRIDIRGRDTNNQLRQDNLELIVNLDKKNARWISSGVSLINGETITAKASSFNEVKSYSDVVPANYLRREAIRRGGYAISMCDYNNDNNVDMLIGHMGAMEVYKGLGNGKFKKTSNKSIGLEDETLVKSIACNDLDNDGLKDLLVVRFAPSEQKGNDLVLYRNTGEGFAKSTSIKNRQPTYYAMPSAVADYNNDGLLDFYVGFPGAKDFTVLSKKADGFVGLKEAHPQGLFFNIGKFAFNEVTKEKIPHPQVDKTPNNYPEAAVIFPHTSMGVDYNLDGTMDIVVVDDKANLSPLYKNSGNGQFTQVAEKIGISNYDFGMGFTAADLDNDGYLEFIYTNVNFLPTERVHNMLVNNFSDYSALPGTYGLRIFKTKDGKNYSDVTAVSGLSPTGYGLGGVETIDYNNDGNLDFYVPNGLWSGNTKKQDITSLFTRAYSKFDLDYEEVMGSPEGIEQANTSFMKILTDFRGDVTNITANENLHPSMTGFQRNRLYRNNGDGTFTDVAFVMGVDSINDGYVATTADVNHDGKMDLIIRNADPGSEKNKFPSVQVYLNESKLKNKSVMLTLEGTKTNRDAVGVIVEAQIKNQKLVRHLVANNGAAQAQSLIHFGLGANNKIDSLKVRWPSGVVDIYKNITPGNHHYKESNISISALDK
ncbi:CRTAC1 family protein [bacterium]|nr:CRTAC1 family protein [bacterium]